MKEQIRGYSYGHVGQSPVSIADLELLKKTVLFTAEDEKNLRLAGEVLKDQTNDVLDLWYGYVGSNEHLLYYFTQNGQPNTGNIYAVIPDFIIFPFIFPANNAFKPVRRTNSYPRS